MRFDPEDRPVFAPTGYRPIRTFETLDNRSDQIQLYEFCCYANDFMFSAGSLEEYDERAAYLVGYLGHLAKVGRDRFSGRFEPASGKHGS
jgi:hypothetical protein